MIFANVRNEEIIDFNCQYLNEDIIRIETSEEMYNAWLEDNDKVIYQEGEIVLNPDWEEEQKRKERERLDALILTPSDVERALYKAKKMDFEDLKKLIAQQIPNIDIKAVSIEFRASGFWRGAEFEGMRLFDVVGALLGYSSDDMDYLFEHKELPPSDVNIEEAEEL